MERSIAELGPWFYPFDFGGGLRAPSRIPEAVAEIFGTRLEMVNRVADAHFGARLREISCLDIGCHEGFYSIEMARKGVRRVRGIDVREDNLRRARFVADFGV